MTIFRGLLTVLAMLLATLPATMAAADTTTVRFRAGDDNASYSGRIRGDETARFLIDARGGQRMQVSLRADNPQSYFNVRKLATSSAMSTARGGAAQRDLRLHAPCRNSRRRRARDG